MSSRWHGRTRKFIKEMSMPAKRSTRKLVAPPPKPPKSVPPVPVYPTIFVTPFGALRRGAEAVEYFPKPPAVAPVPPEQ